MKNEQSFRDLKLLPETHKKKRKRIVNQLDFNKKEGERRLAENVLNMVKDKNLQIKENPKQDKLKEIPISIHIII